VLRYESAAFYLSPSPHTFQLPDTLNQELYSDSQLQVWAIIGLSELVSASYAEDSYGVVQRVREIIHTKYIHTSCHVECTTGNFVFENDMIFFLMQTLPSILAALLDLSQVSASSTTSQNFLQHFFLMASPSYPYLTSGSG
jgi:hypothetical protein